MSDAFQAGYSAYYDLLYHDKDYAAEARFVAELVRRHCGRPPAGVELLDLACGTGRHLVELARLGMVVAGSDRSAAMLEQARRNLERAGVQAALYAHPFQTADRIGRTFDVVTAMFSAVNYLTTDGDIASALGAIGRLLAPGGLFIFDFWNGNAVLEGYSPVRVKDVRVEGRRLLRTGETRLDPVRHAAHVHYTVVIQEDGKVATEFTEDHHLRYYFPQEMVDLLEGHGLEVVQRCPFMHAEAEITPHEWNLTYVARKAASRDDKVVARVRSSRAI